MIHYLTLAGRLFSEYLDHWGGEVVRPKVKILEYPELLVQTRYEPGVYVFSMIDGLEPHMARFIHELASKLRVVEGMRILNDPAQAVLRFDLHAMLWKLGRNGFRSFRAGAETHTMRFPVFIRSEAFHDGALSPLLLSGHELETWIGRLISLGRPLDDLLVVEFCDTSDASGWYRKFAAFHVAGRIIARSLYHGRHWMLKAAADELSPSMAEAELEYVRGNPHERELRDIFRLARVDYGRIDYSMQDGRVQTWEINLHPTIGKGLRKSRRLITDEVRAIREKTKETFYSRFNEAWVALAEKSPGPSASAIEIQIDPRILGAAKDECRRWRARSSLVAAGMRVVSPLRNTRLRPLLRQTFELPSWLVRENAASFFALVFRIRMMFSKRAVR